MPQNNLCGFSVLINNQQLDEYKYKGNFYIISDLSLSNSNNTKNIKSQPVIPFSVQVRNVSTEFCFWFDMFLDGNLIWSKPLESGQKWIVDSVRDGTCLRELVFSLPLESEGRGKNVKKDLGTIEIVLTEAFFTGRGIRKQFSKSVPVNENSGEIKSLSGSKKDFSKQFTGGDDPQLSVCSGDPIRRFTPVDQPFLRSYNCYRRGNTLGKLKMHYKPQSALVRMGIIPEEKSSPINKKIQSPENNKENTPKCSKEIETLNSSLQNMSISFNEPPETPPPSYDSVVKSEKVKTKNICSASVVKKEAKHNDSVICIGDEDCLILDTPKKEKVLIDLVEN